MVPKRSLYDVLTEMVRNTPKDENTLFDALWALRARAGSGSPRQWDETEQLLRDHVKSPAQDPWRQKLWDIFNAE